jgi:hypothetical protein
MHWTEQAKEEITALERDAAANPKEFSGNQHIGHGAGKLRVRELKPVVAALLARLNKFYTGD